jgi:putative oxidoreductase
MAYFSESFKKIISLIFRFIIGSVFIIAAYEKLLHPAFFAVDIDNYRILPAAFINITAIWVPWLELFCGMFLLLGIWVRANALLFGGILLIFIVAMISVVARGLEIECGCFEIGTESSPVGWTRIVEDMFLFAGSVWLIKNPDSYLSF